MKPIRQPDGSTVLQVEVDDVTLAWLAELADMCHAPVGLLAGSLLRDVCDADQDEHLEEMTRAPTLRVVAGTDTIN